MREVSNVNLLPLIFSPSFSKLYARISQVYLLHRIVLSINHLNFIIGGYTADHPVIKIFWRVVESFTDEEKRKLLKFVTSCSRPPLLGFKVCPDFLASFYVTAYDTSPFFQ